MNKNFECECASRYPAKINSISLFNEIKSFFEEQVLSGIFLDVPVEKPYYSWESEGKRVSITRQNVP